MTEFSQKRFVDLGQELYTNWMKTVGGLQNSTEKERRELFQLCAQYSLEAAEEFSNVFYNQDDN
jgi:hypothetical protein